MVCWGGQSPPAHGCTQGELRAELVPPHKTNPFLIVAQVLGQPGDSGFFFSTCVNDSEHSEG